jgi:hypothetical protein
MAILKRLKSTMTTFEMNAKINGKTKKDKGWNEDHHGWIQKLTNQKVQENQETLIIQNVSKEWWKMDNMWKTSTHELIRAVPPRIINKVFPIKKLTNNEQACFNLCIIHIGNQQNIICNICLMFAINNSLWTCQCHMMNSNINFH